MITLICALAQNHAIGYQNQLLYPIRADLQRFKSLTIGHTLVMGRRTFESLPKGALPHRRNLVVSRTQQKNWPDTEVFSSLEAALQACDKEGEEIFIIGGASIYAAALPIAHRLCLTHVHALPKHADAFFPPFDSTEWDITFSEYHPADDTTPAYTFTDYLRK